MNNTQPKQLTLSQVLEKTAKLHKLLESIWGSNLSIETKENIEWYCDYRLHQYYKQYKNYLQSQKNTGSEN